MKIYFSGSIRGGREDAALYHQLIEELKKYGTVLTEHVGSSEIDNVKPDREIHDQDIKWLNEADIIIAEITTPSLGVGYEIGRAAAMGKKIVCMYREIEGKSVSAMVMGCPEADCFKYSGLDEGKKIIENIFEELC